jgi:hypothetical protein
MGNKIKGYELDGMSIALYADGNTFRVVSVFEGFRSDRVFLDYRQASSYFESVMIGN